MRRKLAALALALVLILPTVLFPLSGCNGTSDANNRINADYVITDVNTAAIDFAVRLLQYSVSSDKNTLISPLSVLCALAMTANGADGNTRTQMENTLGFSVEELNVYLHTYIKSLSDDNGCDFHLANSIWFRDAAWLHVEEDFLQLNADYYGAGIYKAPFDNDTLSSINQWVRDNTHGMIDEILNEIRPNDVMYLINALAFEAEWARPYTENQIKDGIFTTESGNKREVEMMYSEESLYLDDGKATGFIKYYAGGRYALAALLPNQGISVNDYIATLSGPGLAYTLSNTQSVTVNAAMPKFESEYFLEMNNVLKAMGMVEAFDPYRADFTKLGHVPGENIYVGGVLHKTFISVDALGTRAGAATVVIMTVTGGREPMEIKTVYLDRPFVYMLLDCETNSPFFIGTVMDL